MSVRVSAEEMETSGSEKLLAVVLAAFMAVGFIWVLFKLDEIGKPEFHYVPSASVLSGKQRAALASNGQAQRAVYNVKSDVHSARRQLELKREAFRTALEAGQPTSALEAEYRDAQARYAQATQAVSNAQARVNATEPAARAARQVIDAASQQRSEDFDAKQDSHDRQTFVLRLLWVLGLLGVGYRLLGRLRVRRSRYLPVGLAWIGAATLTGLVMAVDYAGDYIEFSEAGPLAISLAGIAMTLVAFAALQRYLRRRVPLRRVRKGHCPFCGFPVGSGEHCEGCGRAIQAPCSACQAPRRVGTQHCAACGAGGG
jgi:hypothetical protein